MVSLEAESRSTEQSDHTAELEEPKKSSVSCILIKEQVGSSKHQQHTEPK